MGTRLLGALGQGLDGAGSGTDGAWGLRLPDGQLWLLWSMRPFTERHTACEIIVLITSSEQQTG